MPGIPIAVPKSFSAIVRGPPLWRFHAFLRSPLAGILIGALALFIFLGTMRAGISHGMDQMITWEGYGRVMNAFAAVLTKERFGEGGYALSNCIHNQLERQGLTGDPEMLKPLGVALPDNFRVGFLDKLLERAWREMGTIPDYCGQKALLRGLGADDVGYVDFVTIAFFLFGPHTRALYYLFFLIYGATLFLGIRERHQAGDVIGQWVLVSVAALIFASCFYSNLLLTPEPTGSGNMLNPRFMPVLGLVPAVHIILMAIDRLPIAWTRLAIVAVQALVVFFAIHIRASAVWLLFAICFSGFIVGAASALAQDKGRGRAFLTGFAGGWPALLSIGIILAGLKIVSMSLHPVYREGGWLQHHAMWHSIYYSLQFHPKYVERYGAAHDYQGGDAMPLAAARAYLKEHPELDKPELYLPGKALKYSEMERLDKLAFFEFVRKDPVFVLETFVLIKGALIWKNIKDVTVHEWKAAGFLRKTCFLGVLVLIGGIAAGSSALMRKLAIIVVIVLTSALASLAIPFLTVPFLQTMSEQIMAVQLAGMLLISLGVAFSARALLRGRHVVGQADQTGGISEA